MGIEFYIRTIDKLKRKKKAIEDELEYNLKKLGQAIEKNNECARKRRKRNKLSKNPL